MHSWRTRAAVMAAVPLLAVGVAACGDDDDSGDGLSGTIRIDGSSTVGPLSEVAAELFMDENSGVKVDVAISGTSGGFEKFCVGENDMNDASREIKESEIELCADNDVGYDAVQVANDALSMVVNIDNPVECLTVDQLNQIWDDGSSVNAWADIDGLDLDGDLADADLALFGPGTDSGTFDFFTDAVNGEEGRIRTDYTNIGEDDNAAVAGVGGELGGMGFIPYSFLQLAGDQIKPLQVDGGDGSCVDPSLDNVQDGSYAPLGRPLFVYASDVALAKEEAVAFMKFYIENADEIAELAGFVPMTDEQKAESVSKIEALAGA